MKTFFYAITFAMAASSCVQRNFGADAEVQASIPASKLKTLQIPDVTPGYRDFEGYISGENLIFMMRNGPVLELFELSASGRQKRGVFSYSGVNKTDVSRGGIAVTYNTMGREIRIGNTYRNGSEPHLDVATAASPNVQKISPPKEFDNVGINGARFVGNDLYVFGYPGFFKTTDLGKTYQPVAPFSKDKFEFGVNAVAERGEEIYILTNGDGLWHATSKTAKFEKLTGAGFESVKYPSELSHDRSVIAFGHQNGVVVSRDGGKTWTERTAGTGGSGLRGKEVVHVAVKGQFIATVSYNRGSRSVSFSKNAGDTFTGMVLPNDDVPNTVVFRGNELVIAAERGVYTYAP